MKKLSFGLAQLKFLFLVSVLTLNSAYSAEEAKNKDEAVAAASPAGTLNTVATSPLPPAAIDALGLSAEAISAKTILEELISRRYSQGISTFVDRQFFTVGAQLVLAEHPKPTPAPSASPGKKPEVTRAEALPGDLLLGSLDIEEILKATTTPITPELRDQIDEFVRKYDIKNVNLSVGLKSSLGEEVKAKTDAWLKDRTKAEFGTFGVASVTFLSDPIEKKKEFIDHLNQFQGLAGQLALAFAILVGMILWGIFSSKQNQSADVEASGAGAGAGAGASQTMNTKENTILEKKNAEEIKFNQAIKEYHQKLLGLLPKITKECEAVIRSWCEAGNEGMTKLVCFAEAMGGEMGRIPVPADSVAALTQAFTKMPEMPLKEKYDALVKIYWDLMMVVNLGSEPLDRPFAYLSTMKSNILGDVLINQNSKMKTLVALFMPDALRGQYLSDQNEEAKLEFLRQALDMGEMPVDEFKGYNNSLKTSLSGGGKSNKDVVVIDSALLKIVKALNPVDEIMLLGKMEGPGIFQFKRKYASLAFLHEWPDDRLKALLSKAMPDEVVAYLQVKMSQQDRIIGLCPPMTAEVALDDLDRNRVGSETEQFSKLVSFTERLNQMVASGEISLETIFPEETLSDDVDEKKAA